MSVCLRLALSTAILAAALAAFPAQAARQDDVLERLRQEAGSVSTIRSDFVQERHLSLFKDTLVSRGKFAFARPGSLRWEYTAPMRSGFAIVGDRGTRWNDLAGDSAEFDIRSDPIMRLIAEQLLAWTRFDLDWLRTRYTFTVLSESPIRLKLTPAKAGEMEGLDSLRLTFSADARTIDTVEIRDKDGDFTRILFQNVVTNGDLPPSTFAAP